MYFAGWCTKKFEACESHTCLEFKLATSWGICFEGCRSKHCDTLWQITYHIYMANDNYR